MKFPKKIFTSVLSFALLANTFIVPAHTVQAAPADDGLVEGMYYGVSSRDIPGWHGAWADWKLGPVTVNMTGNVDFSVSDASNYDADKKTGDEAIVFTTATVKDGKAIALNVPQALELQKGDIYTFSMDMYIDIGAGGATNYLELSVNTSTGDATGGTAQYINSGETRNSGTVVRDFGAGATCFGGSQNWHSWYDFAKEFVRYEVIIDTEDEDYNGQQTIEVNIRNTDYPKEKQHFKALYNQVDTNNSNAVLDAPIDKINQVSLRVSSNPDKVLDAPIVVAFDNIRSSVYHASKGERDA